VNVVGWNVETVGAALLVSGLVLGGVAFVWMLVASLRAVRHRGPLALFLAGAVVAAVPYAVHALNGRVADLGRPVQILDSDFDLRLATPAGGEESLLQLRVAAAVALLGAALAALAVLWLFGRALRQWRPVRWPACLLIVAAVLVAVPYGVNAYAQRHLDLGPRERVVDGEVHLTLTGWDRSDYSFLRNKPDTAVLQMANADVTDDTLEYLRGMTHLRELDLSGTAVTDRGLTALDGLPLEKLHLARTRVTDAGVREHLTPLQTLRLLDVSGTQVSDEALAAWKKARPGRRALH
jgi:hypothetical protein